MNEETILKIIELILDILNKKNSSKDLLLLLSKIDQELKLKPSFLNDLIMETILACHPDKEEGVSAYPVFHLKKALNEYRKTGKTNLLNINRTKV